MAENSPSSAAAEKLAASSDLLTEILIRLPIRSLMRFKSVSKHWRSLITSDSFSPRSNPEYSTTAVVSGLFMQPYTTATIPQLDFIPLTTNTAKTSPHFNDLAFFSGLSGNVRIISSCHGLLLCRFYPGQTNHKTNYVVLNPTTKQFKILPKCHLSDLRGLTLAFDPLRSPHYKVVCVRYSLLDSTYQAEPDRYQHQYHYHVVTYSSETELWKTSGEPFEVNYNKNDSGIYWNGSVHWFNHSRRGGYSQYYDVDEERMGIMPVHPVPELELMNCYGRESRHCGESGGHLHLVDTYDYSYMNRRVDVYEMARDYSKWLVKHRVNDLHGVIGIPRHPWASDLCLVHFKFQNIFLISKTTHYPTFNHFSLYLSPLITPTQFSRHFSKLNLNTALVSVLCVLRPTERDEESFMVMHVNGKLLGYCLADGSCKVICDLAATDVVRYSWSDCYPFVESLSRV